MEDTQDAGEVIRRIRSLRNAKNFIEAEKLGEKALKDFPDHKCRLLKEHAETAIRRKSWSVVIKRLELLISLEAPGPAFDAAVMKLSGIYMDFGQRLAAERLLSQALEIRCSSLDLRRTMAGLIMLRAGGLADASHWRELASASELPSSDSATQVKVLGAAVAGLRLAGHIAEAKALLVAHFRPDEPAWAECFNDGYSTLVIYQNGRTRVEFYTKLFDVATMEIVEASRLAITFDDMNQTWDSLPFAYKPLCPLKTDLLSIRKRIRPDFHQDFAREDFLKLASPLAHHYVDTVALGQSLGGYSALYYASWLPGCRVLATAPRNPLNPKYSGKRYARYDLFFHEYDMLRNETATPTIVYDPKNLQEGPYIKNSLSISFPNARFVTYPYCGHSITRYLLDVGLLKSATLGFCDGIPFPEFDRSLRGKSSEYLRNIAKLNFTAGRKRWALALLMRARELGGNPEMTEALIARVAPPPPVVPEPPPAPPPRRGPFIRIKKWLVRRVFRQVKPSKPDNPGGGALPGNGEVK